MKFISSLAAIAAYAGAVSLSAETDVAAQVSAELTTESTAAVEVEATTEVATEATAEVTTEVEAEATTETATESKAEVLAQTEGPEHGYDGPIVPESYEYAVHDFDLNKPFTDQECYQKQVDIYSDQIIAIEALRLEVMQLTQRITQAEHDYNFNATKIAENKAKIAANSRAALDYKAKIDVLEYDVVDLGECLDRQWSEQSTLRHVLELYCHQFTYVAHLPYQCQPILGAGTHISERYAWPGNSGQY